MRAKTAILMVALVGLHLTLLLAGFVAPCDPGAQDRDLPYAPPTRPANRPKTSPRRTSKSTLSTARR